MSKIVNSHMENCQRTASSRRCICCRIKIYIQYSLHFYNTESRQPFHFESSRWAKFSYEGLHSWPIQNFLFKQFRLSDLRVENHRRWKPMFRIALLGHWLRNSHLDLLTELAHFHKYGFPNSICYCESIQKNNWLIAIGYGK